jgi:hypothetical protein
LSIVNGRSAMSGVITGTGAPELDGCFVAGRSGWATCASAAALALSPRMLRKKFLRGFISYLLHH